MTRVADPQPATTAPDAGPPGPPVPMQFTRAVGVERLLAGVPMRNDAVTLQQQGNTATLALPLTPRWWARPPLTWAFPLRSHRKFALDALGQEIWNALDGHRTVEQIIEHFARQHHLNFQEARLCVTAFLRTLTQRRLIVLWISRETECHATTDAEADA